MAITLPPDFSTFLRLLNAHQVEHLVVGGYAVAHHGYPRTTQDLDVWVAASTANGERVVAALREFGFGETELTPELFGRDEQIVRIGVPPMRLELFTSITGVDFAHCRERAVLIDVDGTQVPVIGLDDLKAAKRAAGRPRDLDDLEHLP